MNPDQDAKIVRPKVDGFFVAGGMYGVNAIQRVGDTGKV
jgi:hypothetical protein